MFLTLATEFATAGGTREDVFRIHPIQLSRWLDEAWQSASLVPGLPIGSAPLRAPFLGDPQIAAALGLPVQLPPPALLAGSGIVPGQVGASQWQNNTRGPGGGIGLVWDHLIYAYLIESTGVFEIFAELVRRLVAGESLGALDIESLQWLRATEELFFRDPPLFSITGISSEARPFARITRRNAYWRMFGLDLPHPPPATTHGEGADWKAHTGQGVNTDFLAKWTELLRQVWMGLENVTNTSGAKPTDDSYLALLCEALQDMMNNRRMHGLLAREEFVHVTVLSWFHLTLQSDTPIVLALKAGATSPADRLARLAARVGMRPAARSRELFYLAQPMSAVLRAIELGSFSTATNAANLYAAGTALAGDMRDLINLWQSATGTRVKDRMIGGGTVSISGAPASPALAPAQPLRIPTPGAVTPSADGAGVLNGTVR